MRTGSSPSQNRGLNGSHNHSLKLIQFGILSILSALLATLPYGSCFSDSPELNSNLNLQSHNVNTTQKLKLKHGSPESVNLNPEPLQLMQTNVSAYTLPANYSRYSEYDIHPIQPGGVVLIGHDSTIVSEFAFGNASLYSDANGTLLPKEEQSPARLDSIYDLASLTKVISATVALCLIEQGLLDVYKPVVHYLPEFGADDGNGTITTPNLKNQVTVLMLLTHTSGFPPDPEPGLLSSKEPRNTAVRYPLQDVPGSTYTYSDLNFINMGILMETITQTRLDHLVDSLITSKLDMRSTFYNAGNVQGSDFPFYNRMVPQEFQIQTNGPKAAPHRPQPVRGTVHDPNAFALGGISGHAGLFSTASDLAKFCQMILNNGTYNGIRVFKPETVDLMFTNFNTRFPDDAHSIGFELNAYYFSGPLATGLQVAGHTGFTGTSLVLDRSTNSFIVHLANAIHPNSNWSLNNIVRQALGYWVARSLGRNVTFPPLY